MDLLSFAHLLFLWLEFLSVIVLSLSLFRISLSFFKLKIAVISFAMALVSFYVRDVMDMFNYSVLLVIVCYITLTFLLLRFPFLYTVLICITGYLACVVIQMTLGMLGMGLGITSPDKLNSSFIHYTLIGVFTAAIAIGLAVWLDYRKLGFMFIVKRFQGRQAMKGYNFVLTAILLLSVVFIQLGVLSFQIRSVHLYLILSMSALLTLAICIAYAHNKKLLRDKYKQSKVGRHEVH